MIVDPSALVAILKAESDAPALTEALLASDATSISAASYVEIAMVIDGRKDPVASRQLDNLLSVARVEIVAFDRHHARVARQAFRDFGRGSGHPARLNFGDCFSYALASVTGQALLYKGPSTSSGDFGHTDITPAI